MNNHFFIDKFEEKLSKFTGAPYVVLTDSCTNALFLCLELRNRKQLEREVLTIPTRTYVSVPQAIQNAGYDFELDRIHWNGNYQLKPFPIYDYAVGFKEDMYQEGTYQCLSFQQKKAIPIGKGGAILLDNYDDYLYLKRMSWDGRDASIPVNDDINNIIRGYHMNMTPEMAAKGTLLLNQYSFNIMDIGTSNDYPSLISYSGSD